MNKIECIEDYLPSSHLFRMKGGGRSSHLDRLPIADSHQRRTRSATAKQRRRAPGANAQAAGVACRRGTSLQLVDTPREQSGTSEGGGVRRNLLVEGAYLVSAVAVAAVLWWTTL